MLERKKLLESENLNYSDKYSSFHIIFTVLYTMSDNFIPLNQSTPVRGKWQHGRNHNQGGYSSHRYQNGPNRRGGYHNRRGNNSRNNSFGTDGNSSFGQDNKINIDAYLHPSMLQDPWASLRQTNN